MEGNIKNKTIASMKWTAFERISIQGVQFLIQILIARILLPSDFGVIGMIAIFIAIAETFIESGFSTALIQKKYCSNKDYSTIFYFNVIISAICYIILFLTAPYISSFYNLEILTQIIRIIGINIIIKSLTIVQRSILIREFDFKSISIANVGGSLISGIVGIVLAYNGFGIWSLIVQTLTTSFISFIIISIRSKWIPILIFSIESFKTLFSFGSKLLATSIVYVISDNIYSLIIGKKYLPQELGFYNKGFQFSILPVNIINSIFAAPLLPLMCKIQDDSNKIEELLFKYLRISIYVIFPCLLILILISEPLINILLTEKWKDVIPYFKVLCLARLLFIPYQINLIPIKAKGEGGVFFKVELFSKIIQIIILIITIKISVLAVCWGAVIMSIISYIIISIYSHATLKIKLSKYFICFYESIILGGIMYLISYFVINFINDDILKIVIGLVFSTSTYIILSFIAKSKELKSIHEFIIKII